MEVVDISDIIGSRGRYQVVFYALTFLSSAVLGTAVVSVQLMAPEVTLSWDWEEDGPNRTDFRSDECKMSEVLERNLTSLLSNSSSRLLYRSPYSANTLTQKLGLVCEKSWLASLANSVYIVGNLFGCLIVGPISEKFGRKPCRLWLTLASAVSNLCMLFPQGYIMFATAIFAYGATAVPPYVLLYAEARETLPGSQLPYFGTLAKCGLLTGQFLLVCFAWMVSDWFYVQLFQTALVPSMLPFVIYLLETPMWLAVRGRTDQAKETLARIVTKNGRDARAVSMNVALWLEQMKTRCEIESTVESGKVCHLFKNRTVTFYTCATAFTMTSFFVMYFSLVMNVQIFGSGMYVDLTVSNVLSLLSVLLSVFVLKFLSIRILLVLCFLGQGINCILYPFLCGSALARTILTTSGRTIISPIMCISVVYISEIYPTSVRGIGVSFNGVAWRTLALFTPFTKELAQATTDYVPFLLFSALSFSSALLFKILPETRGKPVLHTVDELVKIRDEKGPRNIFAITTKL